MSSAGYQVDEDAASVVKSRIYIIRGRGVDSDDSPAEGVWMLMIWSKNVFTLSIEFVVVFRRVTTAPPDRDEGVRT